MKPQAPDRGTLRSAVLAGFAELVRRLGIEPAPLLTRAGLDARALVEPDLHVDALRVNRLLELAAVETGCEDFGLRLAQMHGIANLGPIGILAREEPDVGAALKTLVDYLFLHNRAAHVRIEEDGEQASVVVWLDFGAATVQRQSTELLVGAAVGILRAFLGRDWNPLRVRLMHGPPLRRDVYRRPLRCAVEFDQPLNAVVIAARDLRVPMHSSSPEFERQVREWVEAMARTARSERDFGADLQRLVQVLLPAGKCTADRVARYYGLDRRSVHRRLAPAGLSFAAVVAAVRRDLAPRLLADGRRPMVDVADMLGFAHPSAFTRWFVTEFGCSPTQWRQTSR